MLNPSGLKSLVLVKFTMTNWRTWRKFCYASINPCTTNCCILLISIQLHCNGVVWKEKNKIVCTQFYRHLQIWREFGCLIFLNPFNAISIWLPRKLRHWGVVRTLQKMELIAFQPGVTVTFCSNWANYESVGMGFHDQIKTSSCSKSVKIRYSWTRQST